MSQSRLNLQLAGGLATGAGAAVLVGWAFDIAALRSFPLGSVSVKTNTALSFVLIGLSLLLAFRGSSALRRAASVSALLAGAIGAVTLLEYASGWDPGLDQWLFSDPLPAVATSHPGRMAPDTALCVSLAAASSVVVARPNNSRLLAVASAASGAVLTAVALAAGVAAVFPVLRAQGWWGLTNMAAPTVVVFVVLGAALVRASWHQALGQGLVPFSGHLWRTLACCAMLAIAFALDSRAGAQIQSAHELRLRSILLADELRQSGDDLTRMVRTYVVTLDPVYKRRFQRVLDIRDGKVPRPDDYWKPYWDLKLGDDDGSRDGHRAIPLLELMREAGFTPQEFGKLAQAKASSDGLTAPEFEAMRLVESGGPDVEAKHARARAMLYDAEYHRAKAAVMGPIRDFLGLVDARTQASVAAAESSAKFFRALFAAAGLALMFVLWRGYQALNHTLGGTVDEVHANIAKLGAGDFSTPIVVGAGRHDSVLGWLAQTRAKLSDVERERRQSEAVRSRLATIVASSSDAIIGKSLEGVVTSWNAGAEQLFGYPAEVMIGQPITPLIPEERRAEEARLMARIARDERVDAYDTVRLHREGRSIAVSLVLSPMKDPEGRVVGASAIARDISEKQRVEAEIRRLAARLEERVAERTAQLEAANHELEAFSYSVSHDLRAPLRAIAGHGRILSADFSERLGPEGQRVLTIIDGETQRMGRLIDDLLEFSRLGRQKLACAPLDMTLLARAVFDRQAALVSDRGLHLELAQLPPAWGDRSLISVAWGNLIANAIKFSARRDPAVIEIGFREHDGQTAYFVRDHGVGFDMRYADKLFGVFQRLHGDDEFEGTGVGLALVDRIIRRHGGRIWADAKVGEGATFSFVLPAVEDAA